jgi:tRNA threonylcarbamoyladenosine biosynthesis protein TsaE
METFITNNFEETRGVAQNFIRQFLTKAKKSKKAAVIALEGDLGSGKTTFTQGLAKGLGIEENITSPTFVLMKRYDTGVADESLRQGANSRSLFHIDCYRIEKAWQLQELGFEEIINNPENIVAIEWPERISEILPQDAIKIKFEFVDEQRRKIIINKEK